MQRELYCTYVRMEKPISLVQKKVSAYPLQQIELLLSHIMAPNSIIDITKPRVFKKEEWMGKIYPEKVDEPLELRDFRDAAFKIPMIHREALFGLSVEAFVQLHLPPTQAALISFSAKLWFSTKKPTENVSCLKARKLPSCEFVADAEAHLGQALLDGAESIEDPAYKGEGLPVWAIEYWKEMYAAADAQEVWKKSIVWLQKYGTGTGTHPDINQAQKYLHSLAWGERTLAPGTSTGTTTQSFSMLLSNQMLNTTLVDIMVEWIGARVRADKAQSDKFEVVSLVFMNDIKKASSADDYKKRSPGFLHKLEQRLRGSSKVLLFLAHLLKRTHFDGFEIDFKRRTLSYGVFTIKSCSCASLI